jgi:6-phosphofructokinase 1
MSMTDDERSRLEQKMKRAKREADDLEDEIVRETDEDKKRRLTGDLEDAQSKARRLKRKLRQLHTEVLSNPRLCIVQLYGSDSGFMVSHAALASGVCDAALIPEVKFSMKSLAAFIVKRLQEQFNKGKTPHGVILIAETSIPEDVEDFFEDPEIGLTKKEKEEIQAFLNNGRRVYGQTQDELRSGGLRVISKGLLKAVQAIREGEGYWQQFRVFVSEPRHLIRAVAPTAMEIIFGHRLGTLAVDTAMAGYTDCMISQWLTEYVIVPLSLIVLGKKRVPPEGIFWRSVVSSTNQPDTLVDLAEVDKKIKKV